MQIPLILVLWKDVHFNGAKRVYLADDPSLVEGGNSSLFDDQATSVGVHPGPNFDPNNAPTVSLFEDPNYSGKELVLLPGIYPDLRQIDFNDKTSSLRFNAPGARNPGLYENGEFSDLVLVPAGEAAQISPIPLVVQLYSEYEVNAGLGPLGARIFAGYRVITIVETSLDLREYGNDAAGSASFVKVVAGPNPTGNVRLYRKTLPDQPGGPIQGGGHVDLGRASKTVDYQDMQGAYDLDAYGFAGETNSLVIQYTPINIGALVGAQKVAFGA